MSAPSDDDDSAWEHDLWWGRHMAESRWQLELARLLLDPVLVGRGVPRGDGRPVLLCPGFMAGDQTLIVLATFLRGLGYRPATVGFVANVDCGDRAFERVERRAEELASESGRRVAVVGHSRGGHFAKALGALRPELCSHALSLGAGLRVTLAVSRPTEGALALARAGAVAAGRARDAGCLTKRCRCRYSVGLHGPFPTDQVRLTSVFSKEDGVVKWQAAVVAEAECREVTGSHVGLVFNRAVYHEIAAALAQPELQLTPA